MTNMTLTASTAGVQIEPKTLLPAIFINWPVDSQDAKQCDLLDGTDFSDYKLAFFDPLEFAISHKYISGGTEISEVVYLSLDEREFLRYLGLIKRAAESIRAFLETGGQLVIRSNIPRAHIKVRKRSATGSMKYTESVVPFFFWLEDIVGVCSFTFCNAKTLKFTTSKNPLADAFEGAAVRCVQTLNSIGKGSFRVIATSGMSAKASAVSMIIPAGLAGQVYLIPYFIVKHEHQKLVEAFEQIASCIESGSTRPAWLSYYESQIMDYSPYRPMIDEVKLQVIALEKQQASLMRKQDLYNSLVDLLFENGPEIISATRVALEIMGFRCLKIPADKAGLVFEAVATGDTSSRILVRVVATESGPIAPTEVENLAGAVSARSAKTPVKGVLIGNPTRSGKPEQRLKWFDDDCLPRARKHNMVLMPTLVLFTVACYLMTRTNTDNIESLKSSLRRDLFDCDSVFVFSRKKYAV